LPSFECCNFNDHTGRVLRVANTPIPSFQDHLQLVTHNEGENRNASYAYSNNNPINICKKNSNPSYAYINRNKKK